MATAAVITSEAGSVEMALPAGAAFPVGGITVNSTDAGAIWSTHVSTVRSTSSGAATHGGCTVTTARSGSVTVDGPVRNVNTSRAGSVKINFTAPQAVQLPATGAQGNGQETVSWTVAAATAAALDLFDLAHCTDHGDKLRAFLVLITGTAEVLAQGAVGRRILYASLGMLLVGMLASY